MRDPVVEEDGARLILRGGNLPLPVALISLALTLAIEAWLLHEIATLLRAGSGLYPVVPLCVGALITLTGIVLTLFAPLASELVLDPDRLRADLRWRSLIWRRHQNWPLAALPMPQVRYDKGDIDSLPSWRLRIPLPQHHAPRAYDLNFHFRGTASVHDHLAREKHAAEELQIRVAGLIEQARSTGPVI
ncbi:MAG: hypothetical protein AB7U46_15560 [Paenirhodobacter sp.]|uniref:hypothetical protein n=1 Tax=Paenirhodobacter sp. TaxID=1965326 RepID=UPI003D10415D